MPASEIYLEAPGADPVAMDWAVVREAHQRLRSGLAAGIGSETGSGDGRSLFAELIDFCLHELRPYLAAVDQQVYAPASGTAELRLLVDALRLGATTLNRQIDALTATNSADVAGVGRRIAATLELHLMMEESVLLPALRDLPGFDGSVPAADLETLVAAERTGMPAVIDVRRIARGGRHPRVFARFARLAPGEAFILIHSHDPRPLRREIDAIYSGAFSWDYLQKGPDEWRVRIGRVAVDA